MMHGPINIKKKKIILASQAHSINQYKNLRSKGLKCVQIFISTANALHVKRKSIVVFD